APATITLHTPAGQTGIVRVGGTAGSDTIVMTHTADNLYLQVSFNGTVVSNTLSLASISQVRVFGREGNDNLQVSGLTLPFYLDGGAGNDTLLGGSGNDILSRGPGTNSLNRGPGPDHVQESADADFTLTNSSLVAGLISDTLSSIEAADLTGGPSDHSFNVSAWTGSGSLTGGGGNDTVVATGSSSFTLSNTALAIGS